MLRPDASADALDRVSELLLTGRPGEAEALAHLVVKETTNPADRAQALISRSTALLNLGRMEESAQSVAEAFQAVRNQTDPCLHGQLNAIAAMARQRDDDMEQAATHLVYSANAMNQVTVLNSWAVCGWNDLAMAYSYLGFHEHATSAFERMREVAAAAGIPEERVVAPGIRLRVATWSDHQGDTDACVRVLRDLVAELLRRERDGSLDRMRPSGVAGYAYAIARLAALGHRLDLDVHALFARSGGGNRARELAALADVCLAIADGLPIEALARLDAVSVNSDTLGPGEIPRLRVLAHLRAGNLKAAYEGDRETFRVASAHGARMRDVFVQATAARLDDEKMRRTLGQYKDAAHTDPLTRLPNRRALEHHVNSMIERGEPAVVGVCDMDGFKAVNTAHGHLIGDRVLQRVGEIILRVMRREDFVARYGGDEFVVVLPNATLAEAADVARRIMGAVAGEEWHIVAPGTPIGVSIGWAEVNCPKTELREALTKAFEAADRAMLSAKPRARAS